MKMWYYCEKKVKTQNYWTPSKNSIFKRIRQIWIRDEIRLMIATTDHP